MLSQTWMTGVSSSLIVRRCCAMRSAWLASCEAVVALSCSWPIALSFAALDIARQLHPEDAPGTRRAGDGDLPLMGLGHLLDEREAEAEAAHIHLARVRRAPEFLEDAPLGLRGDAD